MEIERQTILIVDDEPNNIEVLNGVLGEDNDILFATSGKDAMDIACNQVPDLILLDIMMPDIDGYEVLTQLKADSKTNDIPVIIVTGKDLEEDESRGLNAGAVDYITKPIRTSIVKARVHNHLELKRYRDSLKTLSTIDGLTGLSNRRRLDEMLNIEWSRARRNQTPISLLLMDIDFFKSYNDHYGHLDGDDCLRNVTRKIAEVARRPTDVAARYGGEEFVLLLPDTAAEGALKAAQNVQGKIETLNQPHAYSSVADHVTLSIGIATIIPDDSLTPSDLIKSADEMLYAAKQGGRNQIKIIPE